MSATAAAIAISRPIPRAPGRTVAYLPTIQAMPAPELVAGKLEHGVVHRLASQVRDVEEKLEQLVGDLERADTKTRQIRPVHLVDVDVRVRFVGLSRRQPLPLVAHRIVRVAI